MAKENSCDHCGADCGKHPIIWNDKQFCCNGCKQVFQLLHESNMGKYYSYTDNPGIKVDELGHDAKFAFLDKEEIKFKMYDFFEGEIAKVTFYIPSIHCASCIWLLEHLNKLHTGVKHSAVQFVKKEYTVSFNVNEISLRQLVELLSSIHYIPDLSLQRFEKKEEPKKDKILLYKIGVAGFVFGNVMLYSLPEYFNGEKISGSLGTFLYYLCYALTVPLVFYSGSDYIKSAWKNIVKGIVNIDLPIALGIITLFSVTSYEVLSNTGPGYSDSLAGFLFFLLLGKWYQSKTYQSLSFDRDYKSYFPVAVTKIEDGKESSILIEEVSIGDELVIRNKELIPADSTLISGLALIDYSFVTGESTAIKKDEGEPLYAGGIQTSGAIHIRVEKEVKQSHLTQLWNQSEKKFTEKKSLGSIIDSMSVYFTIAIIIIAISAFTYWFMHGSFGNAILVLTSVLIVACPCALALSLPFTFGTAMRMLGVHGMYIKNVDVIEKLTKLSSIVFDKTGTITQPNQHQIEYHGLKLNDSDIIAVVSVARQSTHPLSSALVKKHESIVPKEVSGFTEMSGKGIHGIVAGKKVLLGSAKFILGKEDSTHTKGSQVYISIDSQVKGYFEIHNKYREGFGEIINNLAAYKLYVSSGDNASESEYLEKYFAKENMFFKQQPQDKMDFIANLRNKGEHVLMTGDGLNDAGAFMQADIAVSIADDVYHFSPAGDAIIQADSFKNLANYIRFSHACLRIVRLSFIISLFYNCVGIAFAVTGNLSPVVAAILMPVSSISVVAFATFSTQIVAKRMLKN